VRKRHFYITYLTAVSRAVTGDRASCLPSFTLQLLTAQIYTYANQSASLARYWGAI